MKKIKLIMSLLIVLLQSNVSQLIFADTFSAQGTLAGTSTFTTRVFNTADGSTNGGGILGFNAPTATVISSPQAIEINFNDNNIGNQAINIHVENPGGQEGMVGVSDSSYVVPLMWVVFDDPVSDSPDTGGDGVANNYTFIGNTTQEAFVVDVANPDVFSYGNAAFSIDGDNASLSNFPTDNGAGSFRQTTDGQIWMYFGANYTGAPAQDYQTASLVIDLVNLP